MTAAWTGPTCVLRRAGNEPVAFPRQFVIQVATELEPTLIEVEVLCRKSRRALPMWM